MFYFWGVDLDLDNHIFPLADMLYLGDHLKLELSCIWVSAEIILCCV